MQYDFTVAAGGSQTVEVTGTYFRYKNGLGPIRVIASSGGYVDLLPGQGMAMVSFVRLTVKDISGNANTGAILAGDGAWVDERITGTVDVVDGGRTRTLSGIAFIAPVSEGPATGGGFLAEQIWNPVGSGKNIIVERVVMSSSTGQFINIGRSSGTVTNLAQTTPQSKKLFGAASIAQLRINKLNGTQVAFADLIFVTYLPAFQAYTHTFIEPIVVAPGTGLAVVAGAINTDLPLVFEFYEDSI